MLAKVITYVISAVASFVVFGVAFANDTRATSCELAKRKGTVLTGKSWMHDAFRERSHTQLKTIVLPGTHNSGSYKIQAGSRRAPGTPVWYAGPSRWATAGWAKCQNRSIAEQLRDGIRYLDWRVAFDSKRQPIIVHGLESISLATAIAELNAFVAEQPHELVLISASLNKDYEATLSLEDRKAKTAQMYAELARTCQQSSLEPAKTARALQQLGDRSLQSFWQQGVSVIILKGFKASWFNKQDLGALKSATDAYLEAGNEGLFAFDLILTPTSREIAGNLRRFAGSLFGFHHLYTYQESLLQAASGWLSEWQQKKHRINIVTLDFYEKSDFVSQLIHLNLCGDEPASS